MKHNINTLFVIIFFSITGFAQTKDNPYLKNNQLYVDGKPFIMIAGELHNSSASSIPYMDDIWPKVKSLNLNTVLATVSWDQFEQKEGVYDYEMIDYLVENSRKNELKLVVVWFGSWKNGQSSYAPLWVKQDTKRFPRVLTKEGKAIETLSVFSDETRNADARAFSQLMSRIREIDKEQTVIMVQPENEVGIFQDIDYRKAALSAYSQSVPSGLMTYLSKNKKTLKPELLTVWSAHGHKTKGSWSEVFGDNPQSKEFFMAWHYADFINHVAREGRSVHDVPMFVNAWIVQDPADLPGVYPNGGPVSRVMDIYKAAAPSIDIVTPDIYLPNYKEIYEMYVRSDNPLLVPESSLDAARAFYAFGEYNAICFSPFGIEDAAGDILFSESYAVLNEVSHLITKYQYTGKMRGIHLTTDNQDQSMNIGKYKIDLKIQDPEKPAFGLVIHTEDNEFIVVGMNFKAWFSNASSKSVSYIGKVTEGHFMEGQWIEARWLNGDETYHHELLRALGRENQTNDQFRKEEIRLEVAEGEQFVYSPGSVNKVITPGIYKVLLYQR